MGAISLKGNSFASFKEFPLESRTGMDTIPRILEVSPCVSSLTRGANKSAKGLISPYDPVALSLRSTNRGRCSLDAGTLETLLVEIYTSPR